MESREYEFDSQQNQLIGKLGGQMQLVGFFTLASGIISIGSAVLAISQGNLGAAGGLSGLLEACIGIWILQAGLAFKRIVKTEGNDMANLMVALGKLQELYALQFWLLIFGIILTVIVVIIGFTLAASQ